MQSARVGLRMPSTRDSLTLFPALTLVIVLCVAFVIYPVVPSASAVTDCDAPTIHIFPAAVAGLSVNVNGVTSPGGDLCSIQSIGWAYGDGLQTNGWFPSTHTYANAGTYTITATSHQSDGKTTSASENVTVLGTAASSPLISNINPFQTSLRLPPGHDIYIYGFATGGRLPSVPFRAGEVASAMDQAGILAADLAVTISNNNSFTTDAEYYTIGGASVSGFTTYQKFLGVNATAGASSASTTITVTQNNSLVVIVALSAGETNVSLSGIPNLVVQSTTANTSGMIPVVIASATLSSGIYTVTETTAPNSDQSCCNDHMADLISAFVFTPTEITSALHLSGPDGAVQYYAITPTDNQGSGPRNYSVTVYATDLSGHKASCTETITVPPASNSTASAIPMTINPCTPLFPGSTGPLSAELAIVILAAAGLVGASIYVRRRTQAKADTLHLGEGERRLAAVMFADMVGYSAITHADEGIAMRLLEEQRMTVRPIVKKFNGREIKTMGDAFLIEFPSALEAVKCSFETQQSIHEFDVIRPERVKILLRIGIHLGDVIHSQRDVYGDAVNVASRIEPLASLGGICVTKQVFDEVHNKVELQFLSIGVQKLKNLAEDYEVYKIILPWELPGK